jgi:hypothetical protein
MLLPWKLQTKERAIKLTWGWLITCRNVSFPVHNIQPTVRMILCVRTAVRDISSAVSRLLGGPVTHFRYSWTVQVSHRWWPIEISEDKATDTAFAACHGDTFHVLGHTHTNSVAFGPQANYTDWATATCWRNVVPTFVDRGVSRGQRGGSPTVVNLSFLDRSRYFSFK